jgi:hypothetical protein
MFNNLDEQIQESQGGAPTRVEQLLRFAAVAILSVILFGGLYLGVALLE